MTILAESPVSSNSNESISYRLCVAAIVETRLELARFAARVPEFRIEIVATPRSSDPDLCVTDLDAVECDMAGLADLLTLIEKGIMPSGDPLRVYNAIAAPVTYDDALTLIVARVEALADRLESHLKAVGDKGYNLTGKPRKCDGLNAGFRVAAWGAVQSIGSTSCGVLTRKLKAVKVVLADALTAEATAADGDETNAEEVLAARS